MKLTDLKKKGAIVRPELVSKTVTWSHVDPESGERVDDTFEVQIKRLSYGQVESIFHLAPEDPERSYNAALISLAVVLDREQQFSYEDAYQLDPSLAYSLIGAINDVNRRGASSKKSSPAPMKSGTSSSSTASAEEPSPKPSSE